MGNKQTNSLEKIKKIVFLDVDGVLNNDKSSIDSLYIVEPELILILKKIIESSGITETCIVLSSTWRYTFETRGLIETFLKDQGLGNFIKSCTPQYSNSNRVYEILSWLETNTNYNALHNYSIELPELKHIDNKEFPETFTQITNKTKLNVDSILILDDMDMNAEVQGLGQPQTENLMKFLNDHFVHIKKRYGLTDNNAKLAIAILNKNKV